MLAILPKLQPIDDARGAQSVSLRTVPPNHPLLRRRLAVRTSSGRRADTEIAFFIGAFILLTALIYATLSYRSRAAQRVGEDIVRDRYQRNET